MEKFATSPSLSDVMDLFSSLSMAPYTPKTDPLVGATLASISVLIMTFGILVQRSIFKLLRRRQDRGINRLIFCHQGSLVLLYLFTIQLVMETFIAPFKLVIGEYGCYAIDFIEFFAVMVLQVSSFYWSLYRYICIVHSSVVLRLGLSPMGFANLICLCNYGSALLVYLTFRFLSDVTPATAGSLITCLGRQVEAYNLDFSVVFCQGQEAWTIKWGVCKLAESWMLLTSSNLIEMVFIWRSIVEIKSKTDNVKGLLSIQTWQTRQREDRVMFAVNAWQCFFEIVFTVLLWIYYKGCSLFFEYTPPIIVHKAWSVFSLFFYCLQNRAVLLGERQFQRQVHDEGVMKALFKAFRQDYK